MCIQPREILAGPMTGPAGPGAALDPSLGPCPLPEQVPDFGGEMASSSRNPSDLTYFEGNFHLIQPNTLENEERQANQMDNHLYA